MAKTATPGIVELAGGERFVANAVPDPFDARDLVYRPRLELLAPAIDQRDLDGPYGRYIMRQQGNSCVGHALATVINVVLSGAVRRAREQAPRMDGRAARPPLIPDAEPVSPYMLYRLARRYDEFPGELDAGSSIRGALKGWFHHGLALEWDWPELAMDEEPDLDDEEFVDLCRDRPLGAFYRVNPYRLDDMQSAINELHAICVSARVHQGWIHPLPLERGDRTAHVIARPIDAVALGGHAFALVGYDDVGFLVQNSWGTEWGKGGFATLPYEDWLDSAYDAWVVRPGVPQTPFVSGRQRSAVATGGVLATGGGPDLRRLERHLVNLGEGGRLSSRGVSVSTPAQIDRAFRHMEELHAAWTGADPAAGRHVVLYAHGGLAGESPGVEVAQRHLDWWLSNRVYPLYFAWESGRAGALLPQLRSLTRGAEPEGGIGFDLVEQFDRLVERTAHTSLRWMWEELKEHARLASAPISAEARLEWPPRSSAARDAMAALPGASLAVSRLRLYARRSPDPVHVHLVGHGAGAVFLAALLERLAAVDVRAESMALLGPALRVDDFAHRLLPLLRRGRVARFTVFALGDARELDDMCRADGEVVYRKSLLYLVSRALEARPGDRGEAPLLGMERAYALPVSGDAARTLDEALREVRGAWVVSPASAPANLRSDATTHAGLDDDSPTMTSVLLRMLDQPRPRENNEYVPYMALREVPGLDRSGAPRAPARAPRGAAPLAVAAATRAPGRDPLVVTGEPQTERPRVNLSTGPAPEVGVAPATGSTILDVLECRGWRVARDGEDDG
jgi:hypothetical protein